PRIPALPRMRLAENGPRPTPLVPRLANAMVAEARTLLLLARSSQRLQVLHQVSLLLRRQTEVPNAVVVRNDIGERGGTAIVEVRCVLPQRAQRSRAVRLVCGARRVRAVDASLRGRVQRPVVVIGAGSADVAARAGAGKHGASARRDGGIEASGRRWRRR